MPHHQALWKRNSEMTTLLHLTDTIQRDLGFGFKFRFLRLGLHLLGNHSFVRNSNQFQDFAELRFFQDILFSLKNVLPTCHNLPSANAQNFSPAHLWQIVVTICNMKIHKINLGPWQHWTVKYIRTMYIVIDDERDSNNNGNNDWKLGLDF